MSSEQVQAHVDRIIERSQAREARRAARLAQLQSTTAGLAAPAGLTGPAPVLVAEGDSWFNYPGTDILEELEGLNYDVRSVSNAGDTLQSMAYDEKQLDKLNDRLMKLARKNRVPKAILLSAGGNDIAGEEFVLLLNHARSGLGTLSESIVEALIDVRLRDAYIALIRKIAGLNQANFGQPDLPVVVHGYDYPVPDGRGFWGGWGPLPGPWLRPGFRRQGYEDLAANTDTMRILIDRFNDMLTTLTSEPDFQHVHYVNLRGTLSNTVADKAYKDDWDNEMHPEDHGFVRLAKKFQTILGTL